MHKILLLSAYDALSHRYWREGLATYLVANGMELHQVALPARYFAWRSRGNSLTFAFDDRLQQDFDLLIVTSMTDLSALRGLNSKLSAVPAIAYFHENQFAYPDRSEQGLLERQLTSIYTALAADVVVFNSQFNRSTFMQGMVDLLRKMPDGVPPNLSEQLLKRSVCLPVALKKYQHQIARKPGTIVWNHRWEYDKGPKLLLDIFKALIIEDLDFRVHLLGQRFRQIPDEMLEITKLLRSSGRAGQVGFIESFGDYQACLQEAQIVLSTSRQEFQGLAVQEAIAAGCTPVVPDDLCYREYVSSRFRYSTTEEAVEIIRRILVGGLSESINLTGFTWPVIGPQWLDLIDRCIRLRGLT